MKEQILEPVLRYFRLQAAIKFIRLHPNCTLLDIGCGFEAKLLLTALPFIKKGLGIDKRAPSISNPKISTIRRDFGKVLPFENESVEFITLLAVLEHIEDDFNMLMECSRILRPGGGMLITVPSWRAKPILEFLSVQLNVVNKEEILDHKRYYDKESLFELFSKISDLRIIEHKYFQLGCNNSLYVRKK